MCLALASFIMASATKKFSCLGLVVTLSDLVIICHLHTLIVFG